MAHVGVCSTGSSAPTSCPWANHRRRLLTANVCRLWGIPHKRHSLAVHSLITWHDAGADVEVKLPLLSTWLGHVDPTATYWYLQAAPELLRVVAQRLEPILDHALKDPS